MPLINGVGIKKTDSQTMKSESNIKNNKPYQHHNVLASLIKVKQSTLAMTKESEQDRLSKQKKVLLNKSIEPLIASKLLTCVQFDGFGKIISLTMPLKDSDFNLLINNTITPLTETPVLNRENNPITNKECLMKMACVIKKSNIPCDIKKEFLEKIKYLFLSNDLSNESLNLLVKKLIDYIEPDHPVIKKMNELINKIEKSESIHITKHNDNYYGRTFDSAVAELTITQPSPVMKHCISVIFKELSDDFISLSQTEQEKLIENIYKLMITDNATWYGEIPNVIEFLSLPSFDNFYNMMNESSDLKNLLIMFLAIKYTLASPGLYDTMVESDYFYDDVIVKQRNFENVQTNKVNSTRTGINLFYQTQSKPQKEWYQGVRPIDKILLQTKQLSEHNKLAHSNEKPVAVGMSGSSSILSVLFDKINSKADFNIDEAKFLAACVLTYSGGHSLNEAYTVFNYNEKEPFSPINYWSLSQSSASIKNIMDSAYEHVINEAMKLNIYI